MVVNIEHSWKDQLNDEFGKPYFSELTEFVKKEYHDNTIYPQEEQIFNAFECCPFDKVKVVILGQDPYHGPSQAHGLSFSVRDGVAIPPSLKNIFKELHNEYNVLRTNTNLESWAKQGVLLLNTSLTVRKNKTGEVKRREDT